MVRARAPEVLVTVNGMPVAGVLHFSVSTNAHLAANRFTVDFALDASGYGIWSVDPLVVEIRVGLAGTWTSLIYGQVDEFDLDVGRKRVRVEGRDLTSRFIEARSQESFENQTASEIASTLATRRGLQPVVTATSNIVGRDFQNGYSRITLDQHARVTTEWDLLIRLAEGESFDVWVDGQQLKFCPPDQNANVLPLSPPDCLSLRLRRVLALSDGLQVDVKSWDCRGQRAIIQTASSNSSVTAPRVYAVVRPNLTDASAQGLAQRILSQMSQHERSITVEMPGDITTNPRDIVTLTGTGTDFDGAWAVTDVDRHLSFEGGFVQTLEARIPPWTVF